MKKLSLLSFLLAGLLIFSSCDKGELGPVANSSDPEAPEISSPSSGESFALNEENAEEVAMTIEWSKPDFGFSSAPTYTIEFAEAGSDSGFVELDRTQQTSYDVVTQDLNNALIGEEFATGQEHSIDLRVVASLPDESVSPVISTAKTIAITPYFAEISYPEIYVPGGYQGASNEGTDWTPSDAPALYSFEDNDMYEGYVYMAGTDNLFKFTPDPTWDNGDWGDTGADGTLDEGGDNISLTESGYYYMEVDLNDLTYSVTNTEWAVTGSATPNGWANEDEGISDHNMTYDSANKVWTIDLNLSAGEMKFRANDAWDIEYGDDEGDGRLELGGSNIAIEEAGNYTIELDLSEAPFSYTVTQN
ncbi:SusE domain-containing protein [Fodinibius sp. Rm-B-1B1-1]|uniref:SusE domain-containing protein n=1 Tax=Fodinibius alkaliphilus TaxID=3140241 RepID=UPI00315A2699